MIIFSESRQIVVESYRKQFERVGELLVQMQGEDLIEWLTLSGKDEVSAVEAVLIGDGEKDLEHVAAIRSRLEVPVIALLDNRNLQDLVSLYHAGADDVVCKPVHCEELMVRIAAIKKRILRVPNGMLGQRASVSAEGQDKITIFFDGADPLVNGEPLSLPRRERRILEYLASVNGRRVTKAQLFSAIYGLFDDHIDENVIESHISKLRKKLREALGSDPIDSKRYLGYQIDRQFVAMVNDRSMALSA